MRKNRVSYFSYKLAIGFVFGGVVGYVIAGSFTGVLIGGLIGFLISIGGVIFLLPF